MKEKKRVGLSCRKKAIGNHKKVNSYSHGGLAVKPKVSRCTYDRVQEGMMSLFDGAGGSTSTSISASTSQLPSCARYHPYARKRHLGENVMQLLTWREVAPSLKRPHRHLWGGTAACSGPPRETTDTKQALTLWLEAESLRHCTAKYCSLHPDPRSTIAAAFSPDGGTLASTHGDHTVKIICCRTGHCLKVLSGHRRTPWVVRFHPSRSKVLASGSLDNEVRLWDATTSECIHSRDFYRPIASLAFHADGDVLAVASGHKLYMWQYTKEGEAASPIVVLRTRRSLRAVHFHPHAAPFLLTAEVNDLDSSDCPMTIATSQGYMHYPAPAIHFTLSGTSVPQLNPSLATLQSSMLLPSWFWPSVRDAGHDTGIFHPEATVGINPTAPTDTDFAEEHGGRVLDSELDTEESRPQQLSHGQGLQFPDPLVPAPMDISPQASDMDATFETTTSMVSTRGSQPTASDNRRVSDTRNSMARVPEGQSLGGGEGGSSPTVLEAPQDGGDPIAHPLFAAGSNNFGPAETRTTVPAIPLALRNSQPVDTGPGPGIWPIQQFPTLNAQAEGEVGIPSFEQFSSVGEGTSWEPFVHGWVQGQEVQAGNSSSTFLATGGTPSAMSSLPHDGREFQQPLQQQHTPAIAVASVAMDTARISNRAGAATNVELEVGMGTEIGPGIRLTANQGMPIPGRGGVAAANVGAGEAAAQAAMAAATATAVLPCTVKLRIWPYDIKHPVASLASKTCRFTIPHAVLCSEMGAHFSPCGRFLAACVACIFPPLDSEASGHALGASVNGSPNAGSLVQSPTQHPMSSQRVIYELRVYSLEEATFGQVLASRVMRAAHCLTSIQFSPTSGHLLLAYGRRHNSLLRSLIVDGTTTTPIYTILEVYRVSDMELVRVLPSAEDEVNVACFHPCVGGGLVYGTKEGKLRMLRHDRTPRHPTSHQGIEDDFLEIWNS